MTEKNRIIELLESFTDTAGLIDVSVYDNDDAITLELSDGYGHEWFTADYDVNDLKETLSRISYELWNYDSSEEAETIIKCNIPGKPDYWTLYNIASDVNKTAENLAIWIDEKRKER